MIVDEQIQSYDTFWVDKTKPLQSGFVGTISVNSGLILIDPELMERVHVNEQPITTQSTCDSLLSGEPARFKTCLLKVKRLKNTMNLNAFPLKYLSMKEDK